MLRLLTLYDLMRLMLRRFSIFIFLVAVLIAIEPLLHSHPLEQDSIPGACAICAAATAPLPLVTATVSAPQLVVYTLSVATVMMTTTSIVPSLASRAPPSA